MALPDLQKFKLQDPPAGSGRFDLNAFKKQSLASIAPTVNPKKNILDTVDSAISSPAFDMGDKGAGKNSGLFGTIFKSLANTAKDAASFAYGVVKSPVVAAKNIGYDIPKAVFSKQDMGAYAQPGTKPGVTNKYPVTARNNPLSRIIGAAQPDTVMPAFAKTILPPALQELGGVNDNFKPQPYKALKSLAEKPVTNIMPVVGLATGIAEGKGTSSGGMTTGFKPLDTVVEKVGGAGRDTVAAPFVATKAAGKAIASSYEGTGITKSPEQLVAASDKAIREGMQKGVKPTILGKQSMARQSAFYESAKSAVKTISENRSKINIVDPETGEVTNKPQSVADFAQAIPQAKKLIYDQYSAMSKAAGEAGATANVRPIIGKLYKTAFSEIKFNPDGTVDLAASKPNVKYSPETRKYALDMIAEVKELQDQPPEIIEARIKDLNSSLAGYYEGRTVKAKAQVDASIATNLREILDNNIEAALQKPGYQELKIRYGDLKALEKDVNKRAVVLARQNAKSLPQTLTDVWSGAELAVGLLGDPTALVRGVASKGIMSFIKRMNAPDTYIKKMFDSAYDAYPETAPSVEAQPINSRGPQNPQPPASGPGLPGNIVPRQLPEPQVPAAPASGVNWKSQSGGVGWQD